MKPIKLRGRFKIKSLRFRLLVFFTLLSALITLTFTVFYVYHLKQSTESRLRGEAGLIISSLKSSIRLPLYAEFREGIAAALGNVVTNDSVLAIKVLNRGGELLAEIRKQNEGKILSDNIFNVSEMVTIKDFSYSPEALLVGDSQSTTKTIGFVELEMDKSAASNQLKSLYLAALGTGFVFWLFTTLIGYLLLRHITAPFNHLLSGIKEIERGNLSPDLSTGFDEETEQAARAVLDLADTLREREMENRRLNNDLIRSMRLEVREEKRKIMARLINTNRMTSLGLLVSSMAHEINNPNGSIRLSNEFLTRSWQTALPMLDRVRSSEGEFEMSGMPYDEARGEILLACDNISRSSVRIDDVIDNLRNYGLGEKLKPESTIDVNQVVQQAISVLSVHGRKLNVKFSAELAPGLPGVSGNSKQLEQVVINLLMNAAQAAVEGRNIISISTAAGADNRIRIVVADEGKGIDPEYMQRLFDPFFSTRINEGGSGLGLYISKFIVEEHHGSIEVASEVGKGTVFTIILPAGEAAPAE